MRGKFDSFAAIALILRTCLSAEAGENRAAPDNQISIRSTSDSGDQINRALFFAICGARPRDHLFDIKLYAESGIQRPDALVELAAKAGEIIQIFAEVLPDALLIGDREVPGLRDGLGEGVSFHFSIISYRVPIASC